MYMYHVLLHIIKKIVHKWTETVNLIMQYAIYFVYIKYVNFVFLYCTLYIKCLHDVCHKLFAWLFLGKEKTYAILES